jgi:hypothetical protein
VHGADRLLPCRRFVAELALVQVFADLDAALDVGAEWRANERDMGKIENATHSISSSVFFTASGRSLNFVDFVNGGGPWEPANLAPMNFI